MHKILYSWRFYTYGREQYYESMNKMFSANLSNLYRTSTIVSIIALCCSVFPIILEQKLFETCVFLFAALVSFGISRYSNYLMQQINVNNKLIYFLIILFYTNIILFSIYLDIWSNPVSMVAIFPCFLICTLLMFVNSPLVNLILIYSALIIYIVSAFIFKDINGINNELGYYILQSFVASLISVYFNWQIPKLRMGLEISTTMLEDEKNKYFDQSTVDELTQLKNRRDFMHTFQRYLSNYRTSDYWLCIAIADIDYFKFYNDHYGHPQGDTCLRSIGVILNELRDDLGIYTARVGGEEFAALWFEKDITNVDNVVHQWTRMIKNLKIPHEKSKVSEYVTMSIGVYISKCGAYNDTQILYDYADKALYAAKGSRNCAVIYGDEIKQYKINPSDGK